ncbi:hypothetical protein AVEN_219926-1 [Araneus ventricosus]|uniref:Uncharacterized protein n=1 Tax=Araneus ventricosus TaxID=182803 RepID=A0A4Y2TE14_ARAVE|nr:hypothetical protein AVEN_219926-1 [Araneus ventricosus]
MEFIRVSYRVRQPIDVIEEMVSSVFRLDGIQGDLTIFIIQARVGGGGLLALARQMECSSRVEGHGWCSGIPWLRQCPGLRGALGGRPDISSLTEPWNIPNNFLYTVHPFAAAFVEPHIYMDFFAEDISRDLQCEI